MNFDFTEPELDYLYRLLLARPMAEVETLVVKIRQQVAAQQVPRALPNGQDSPKEVIQ